MSHETPEGCEIVKRLALFGGQVRYLIEGHDETLAFSTSTDAAKFWEFLRRIEHLIREARAASPPAAETGRLIEELKKLTTRWRKNAEALAKAETIFQKAAIVQRACADDIQALLARVSGQPVGEK